MFWLFKTCYQTLFLTTKRLGVLLLTVSLFSCQSLSYKKSQTDFSNETPKKARFSALNKPSSHIIDKKQLELLADQAHIKSELAFLEDNKAQAFKDLKNAMVFAPHNFYFQERMARLYESEGLITEAIRIYIGLEQKSPNKQKYREKLVQAYAQNGLYAQALKYHSLLEEHEEDIKSHFQKVALLDQLQQSQRALKELQKLDYQSLSLDQKVSFLLLQSHLFDKRQKSHKSLQSLKALFALDSPNEVLLIPILDSLKQHEGLTLAYVKKWEKERGPSAINALYLFRHFVAKQNWDQAFFYAKQLEELGQLKEEHYFYIANYLIEKSEYQRALPYLRDLSSQKPKNGYYSYLLAVTYGKNQEWKQALATYQAVPSNSSYFVLSQLQIASFWKKQGEHKKSLDLLDRLSKDDKTRPQVILLYAQSLWLSGAKKEALALLAQTLKAQPQNPELKDLMSFYLKKLQSDNYTQSQLSDSRP